MKECFKLKGMFIEWIYENELKFDLNYELF